MPNANKYIIILAILIASFLPILNYNSQTEKTIIKTSFLVGNKSGFDLNPNELTFGQIPPDNSASRSLTITNDLDKKRKISIEVSGKIKKYIIASENNFILNPHESKNVTLTVYSTNLEEPKKYSGEIIIISKPLKPNS